MASIESSENGSEDGTGPILKDEMVTSPSDISMLNQLEMVHVFSFLPLMDLNNCRLVNRHWNQASNRAILKRNHFLKFSEENFGIIRIPGLIRLIKSSSQFPWTKFIVNADSVKMEDDLVQILYLFLVTAPFSTEIWANQLNGEMELFPEGVQFPALHTLALQYKPEVTASEGYLKHVVGIVEQAPKLNELVLSGIQMMPLFMAILETGNCQKITRLRLCSGIEDDHLLKLSGMDLKLKYLQLTFNSLTVEGSADGLKAFLKSLSTCLESLSIETCKKIGNPLKLELSSKMEKLKVLEVSCGAQLTNSSGNWLPALKKFIFSCGSLTFGYYPLETLVNEDNQVVETVEEVDFGNMVSWSLMGFVLNAAKQFPNVRKISLRARKFLLNCLGHCMPHLEEICLYVCGGENLDAILTGFSSEEVTTLKNLPSSQLDSLERNREPVSFLKRIKKIQLKAVLYKEAGITFSDFACRFALLKMEHLEVLEILGNCGQIQISNHVMEAMKSKFTVRLGCRT